MSMLILCQNCVATTSSEVSVIPATALFKDLNTLSASLEIPPNDSKIKGWKTTPASSHRLSMSPLAQVVRAYASAAPSGSCAASPGYTKSSS